MKKKFGCPKCYDRTAITVFTMHFNPPKARSLNDDQIMVTTPCGHMHRIPKTWSIPMVTWELREWPEYKVP